MPQFGKGVFKEFKKTASIPCTLCPKTAFYLARGEGYCSTHREEAVKAQAKYRTIPAAIMKVVLQEERSNYSVWKPGSKTPYFIRLAQNAHDLSRHC